MLTRNYGRFRHHGSRRSRLRRKKPYPGVGLQLSTVSGIVIPEKCSMNRLEAIRRHAHGTSDICMGRGAFLTRKLEVHYNFNTMLFQVRGTFSEVGDSLRRFPDASWTAGRILWTARKLDSKRYEPGSIKPRIITSRVLKRVNEGSPNPTRRGTFVCQVKPRIAWWTFWNPRKCTKEGRMDMWPSGWIWDQMKHRVV